MHDLSAIDAEPRLIQGPRGMLAVGADLAAATRALYGREWPALAVGGDTLSVRFEEQQPAHVALQLSLRCAGCDFELQVVDASALVNLSLALSPQVPAVLHRAALLHALQPLWQALEARWAAPLELGEVRSEMTAWSVNEALGMTAVRRSPDAPAMQTGLLLRAVQAAGWQRLARADGLKPPPPSATDSTPVAVSVRGETVSLTLAELAMLEPGDVLVLAAPAAERERLQVTLCALDRRLRGVAAVLAGRKLSIARCTDQPLELETFAPRTHYRTEGKAMTSPEAPVTDPTAAASRATELERIHVDVEVELGRLSMPLSALRTLSVGQVFETEHDVEGCCVWLWCGGQCLGVGQLVAIGNRLGIRVATLESVPSAA